MMKTAAILIVILLVGLVVSLVVRSGSDQSQTQEITEELPMKPPSDAERLADLREQNAKMTTEQILARSREDLRTKTAGHTRLWHLGSEERWNFSQDEGTLTFTFADMVVVTRAQMIGSYVYSRRSWLWSWGNKHVAESLKEDAMVVRQHMMDRKLPDAGIEELFVDEDDAWKFTALACYLADAQGGYSGQDGDMRAFFTFHSPQIRKR